MADVVADVGESGLDIGAELVDGVQDLVALADGRDVFELEDLCSNRLHRSGSRVHCKVSRVYCIAKLIEIWLGWVSVVRHDFMYGTCMRLCCVMQL